MECQTQDDASKCPQLCCNSFNQCARTQSDCYLYSIQHCYNLICPTCCLINNGKHECGNRTECDQYFQLFLLWALVITLTLMIVLLIIKLRTKQGSSSNQVTCK